MFKPDLCVYCIKSFINFVVYLVLSSLSTFILHVFKFSRTLCLGNVSDPVCTYLSANPCITAICGSSFERIITMTLVIENIENNFFK